MTRVILTLVIGAGLLSVAVAQQPSAYDLGRRVVTLEKRLTDLEQAKPRPVTDADLVAIRSELAALERQVQNLPSATDVALLKKDLAELRTLILRLNTSLAPTPASPNQSASSGASIDGFVKQIGQETFRATVQTRGWYDTRLPYGGNCKYVIRCTGNCGKHEITTGNQIHWYNAAQNNSEELVSDTAGTIKIRINDESPARVMVFELSRTIPAVGFCYGPAFEPLAAGKTMCDIEYPLLGDDTPPLTQGLNAIAPLFGAAPTRSERKRAFNPSCPPGTPGGPPGPAPPAAPRRVDCGNGPCR